MGCVASVRLIWHSRTGPATMKKTAGADASRNMLSTTIAGMVPCAGIVEALPNAVVSAGPVLSPQASISTHAPSKRASRGSRRFCHRLTSGRAG